jgi:hypothetical protein
MGSLPARSTPSASSPRCRSRVVEQPPTPTPTTLLDWTSSRGTRASVHWLLLVGGATAKSSPRARARHSLASGLASARAIRGVLASNGAPGISGTEIRTAGLLNGCHDWEDRWMSGHATVHLATTFDSRGRRVHSVWSQRRVSVVDCLTIRHSDAIPNSIRDSRNGRKRPRTRIVSSIGDSGPARKSEHAGQSRVPPTGFEPVISCVKGRRPNR